MDQQQSKLFLSENEVEEEEVQAEEDTMSVNTKAKFDRSAQLPRQFNKAKRTLTKMINQYFANLKQELLNGGGKFVYNRQYIPAVESAMSKLATIRYTDLSTLVPKKSDLLDDFLLSYISESKKIIKYNFNIYNNNNQKPREVILESEENYQLPDSATPAAFGANAYFFDGSKFDLKRMVYVPMNINYKVNLITGQVSILQAQPSFYRMKSLIIKVKRGFMIIGGYVGQTKALTKQCSVYSVQNPAFHTINSLNKFHNCPSGCIHNEKIYVFSSQDIEFYSDSEDIWTCVDMPRRLRCLPFQYCISVSQNQIMIFGGKICNQNSTDLKIYNTETNSVDEYTELLPVGITSQRSWGPMNINNFITVMSNIQASVYPQVTVKRDAVQLVLVGYGGCYLNTLIAST